MMMDEKANAISFANNFCVLAEGLVPGIEQYLAKDVVLNWFGKPVKGKRKVGAFFKNSKISATHVFTEIVPKDGIEYRPVKSKKVNRGEDDDCSGGMNNQLQRENTPNRDCTVSVPEVDRPEQTSEEKASECELNEVDLNTLSSLDNAEMELATNEIKLEEMMSQFSNIKMKCGHRVDPETPTTTYYPPLKCIEARGNVVCEEKHRRRSGSNFNYYLTSRHSWKKNCKLQIVYSIGKPEKVDPIPKSDATKNSKINEVQPSKLPSFDQVIALSNQLVPDTNHFGGYLRDYHYYAERRKFCADFKSEMSKRKGKEETVVPRTVSLKKVRNLNDQEHFSFNYSIHYIGYEHVDGPSIDCKE